MIKFKTILRHEKYAYAFYEAFILAMVITWLPLKSLAYLAPYVCLGWFILRANSGRTFIKIFLLIYIFFGIILFYYFTYMTIYDGTYSYIIGSSLIALLTYGAFVYIGITPKNVLFAEQTYARYIKIIKPFLLVQALVGMMQILIVVVLKKKGLDLAVGDVVQGTIWPFAFMGGDMGFGNQMFAINMVFLLTFMTPYLLIRRKYKVFILGFFALLLSSVLHVFLALLASIILISFFFRKKVITGVSKPFLIAILFLLIALGSLFVLQPRNFGHIAHYALLYAKAKSPKIAAVNEALFELPASYPPVVLIGLGPGQFSSKAGLIGSGRYFGGFLNSREISFLPNDASDAFKQFFFDIWEAYSLDNATYGSSTMHRPFFSALSILTEFGLVIFMIILGYLIYILGKLRKVYLEKRSHDRLESYLAFACAIGIIFTIMIAFFENYLETAQAIFPGLILLKLFYNLAIKEKAHGPSLPHSSKDLKVVSV